MFFKRLNGKCQINIEATDHLLIVDHLDFGTEGVVLCL